MKSKLVRTAFAVAIGFYCAAAFSLPADASTLDFTFSFTDNAFSNVSGTVTGEIFGLSDNTANQAASQIIINSYPSALGLGSSPILTTTSFLDATKWLVDTNLFTVSAGQITFTHFYAHQLSGEGNLALQAIGQGGDFLQSSPFPGPTIEGTATYQLVTNVSVTPLPAALPLYATGLGALALLRWRRKRKAAVAAQSSLIAA